MGDFWDCEFYQPLPRNLLLNSTTAELEEAVKNMPCPSLKSYSQMERPNLKWMKLPGPDGNVCFRDFGTARKAVEEPGQVETQSRVYNELMEEDEELENIFHIVEDPPYSSQFSCSVQLPCALFGFIIGQRGTIKNGIESATNTKITIPPRSDDTMGKVVIKGKVHADVMTACRKIYHIVETNRSTIKPTHFVGIMIKSDNVKRSFELFTKISSLDPTILQSTAKLHLTLGMLVLLNENEAAAAASIVEDFVFENLREKNPKPKLHLKGLEIMQDDPSMTRVLYGDVVKDANHDEVQEFTKELLNRLNNAGYLKQERQTDSVKLHMTVANSKFAPKAPVKNNSRGPPEKVNNFFDASIALKKFGDYDFGEEMVTSLCICECGSSSAEEGYKIVSQHFLDYSLANPGYICD